MIEQNVFFFEKLCNRTNYFQFIENYLKVNHIFKKDFLNDTGINAGTYRTFLRTMNKNSDYYYEVISKYKNIYLPDEERIQELNEEYTNYFYDLLYLKFDKLKEDLVRIEAYLHPNVETMEELAFLLLHTIIRFSFGEYDYQEQEEILGGVISKIEPYEEFLTDEFNVLYHILKFNKGVLEHGNVIYLGNQLRQMCRNIEVLNGFVLNQISVSMYRCGDYLNGILYGNEACDSFYKQNNYIRLIYTKSNLAHYYLLADDYYRAYQAFRELSYLDELLTARSSQIIKIGIFESLVFMGEYELAYKEYYKNDLAGLKRTTTDMVLLYVCYKLEKREQFLALYQSFQELWDTQQLYEPYYYIIEAIYDRFCGTIRLKQNEKALEMITRLKNKSEKKLFYTFCNEKQ